MSHTRASPQRAQAAERRVQALELRKQGRTFREIGAALGCTEQRAHYVVTQELQRLNRERSEQASEVVRLEMERLDALHHSYWQKAVGGDLDATNVLLKIAARRAKLLGLDAPANVNLHRFSATSPVIVEEVIGDTGTAPTTQNQADPCASEIPPESGNI